MTELIKLPEMNRCWEKDGMCVVEAEKIFDEAHKFPHYTQIFMQKQI